MCTSPSDHLSSPQDLRDEVSKLTRQLAEAKQQLESETLMRVDLENRCQSLKEELQFKQQVGGWDFYHYSAVHKCFSCDRCILFTFSHVSGCHYYSGLTAS